MRYLTITIVSALLFQPLTGATRFKGCFTDPPESWVSNCNQADKNECRSNCDSWCGTGSWKAMANKPQGGCDCYCW
ncbi:uncharacterized protein CTRU02_209085 [Colletotrichum truncatum]|uniref:Uncharacterized protein n=1 Tax=Colletotrichum truncatum TaxID=5467 RepID=A0ACC3YY52_COLTU|nr:uncharacterized protein CTRU02_07724 [Colletotrichum truncatum]KAF6790818.1 hypothetical protein CTRU02_07724 [Colletotrichum truncatum]